MYVVGWEEWLFLLLLAAGGSVAGFAALGLTRRAERMFANTFPVSNRRRRMRVLLAVAAILALAKVTQLLYPSYEAWCESREAARAAQLVEAERDVYRSQTTRLPQVDAAVIYLLKDHNIKADVGFPVHPYKHWIEIVKETRLNGSDARSLASLWRSRKFGGGQMMCHFPVYGVRFFAGDKLLCETSICWACGNIYARGPEGNYTWVGFHDPNRELFEFLNATIPLDLAREKVP